MDFSHRQNTNANLISFPLPAFLFFVFSFIVFIVNVKYIKLNVEYIWNSNTSFCNWHGYVALVLRLVFDLTAPKDNCTIIYPPALGVTYSSLFFLMFPFHLYFLFELMQFFCITTFKLELTFLI